MTMRARVPAARRGIRNAPPNGRRYCWDAHSTSRRMTSRVMQLTAGQRCTAVGFIKQLYLDRLWSYELKVRAINSQSSVARVPLLCRGRHWCSWQLAEKYLFPLPAYRPDDQWLLLLRLYRLMYRLFNCSTFIQNIPSISLIALVFFLFSYLQTVHDTFRRILMLQIKLYDCILRCILVGD